MPRLRRSAVHAGSRACKTARAPRPGPRARPCLRPAPRPPPSPTPARHAGRIHCTALLSSTRPPSWRLHPARLNFSRSAPATLQSFAIFHFSRGELCVSYSSVFSFLWFGFKLFLSSRNIFYFSYLQCFLYFGLRLSQVFLIFLRIAARLAMP